MDAERNEAVQYRMCCITPLTVFGGYATCEIFTGSKSGKKVASYTLSGDGLPIHLPTGYPTRDAVGGSISQHQHLS